MPGDAPAPEAWILRRTGDVVSRIEAGAQRVVVGGLQGKQRVCFTVAAQDEAGNESQESPSDCLVVPWHDPPKGVAAAAAGPDHIELAWLPTPDPDLFNYEVERLRGPALPAAGTSFQATGLQPDREYCFVVRSMDTAGERSRPSAPRCARTTARGGTPGAFALTGRLVPGGSLVLEWQPSGRPGVVYQVMRSREPGGEVRVGSTPRSTFEIKGALDGQKPGRRQCFRVLAVDEKTRRSQPTLPFCLEAPAQPAAAR